MIEKLVLEGIIPSVVKEVFESFNDKQDLESAKAYIKQLEKVIEVLTDKVRDC